MILLNGEIREDIVPLSVLSPHFQYGTGFFETILYHRGKLHFFDDHIRRIENTCRHFSLKLNWSHISRESVQKLIDSSSFTDGTLRIKIIYAPLSYPERTEWDTAVYAQNYIRPTNPIKASVHNEVYNSSFHRFKSMNYDYNRHWRTYYSKKDNSDEVLFCLDQRRVIEGSYTNIIIRKGKKLFYMGKSLPCLPGVAQEKVLEYASSAGYELREMKRGFSLVQMRQAHEIVATNSLMIGENISQLTAGKRTFPLNMNSELRNEILNHFLHLS